MEKFIVLLGPTASGKTKLAVSLANQLSGEIISADSRQIYKGMDIGTGKDLDEYIINNKKINYHLINILEPTKDYSVFKFKKDFKKSFDKIINKKRIPIICGGTGLYIESILLDYKMPKATPNNLLRKKLETRNLKQLISILKDINPNEYNKAYHTSKRRLIRSIEILSDNKKISIEMNQLGNTLLDKCFIIGIQVERKELLKHIKYRLQQRLNDGMIEEVRGLINNGLDINRLHYFGLEYRYIGEYLSNKIDYDLMVTKLNTAINQFSKRQMTFFRRMEKRGIKINWVTFDEFSKLTSQINNFLVQ